MYLLRFSSDHTLDIFFWRERLLRKHHHWIIEAKMLSLTSFIFKTHYHTQKNTRSKLTPALSPLNTLSSIQGTRTEPKSMHYEHTEN